MVIQENALDRKLEEIKEKLMIGSSALGGIVGVLGTFWFGYACSQEGWSEVNGQMYIPPASGHPITSTILLGGGLCLPVGFFGAALGYRLGEFLGDLTSGVTKVSVASYRGLERLIKK
jgi:hypothetical protein